MSFDEIFDDIATSYWSVVFMFRNILVIQYRCIKTKQKQKTRVINGLLIVFSLVQVVSGHHANYK